MGTTAAAGRMSAGSMEGLTETEAARRYKAGEGNNVQARAGRSYAAIIWQATFVPVNLVLFVVSAVLVVLGLRIDAALTAGPVLMNIVVSATMEASAKWRLDRLRILSAPKTTVIREGHERPIDPAALVRGDLIVVDRGDQIVLDGELVHGGAERLVPSVAGAPVCRRASWPHGVSGTTLRNWYKEGCAGQTRRVAR